MVLDGVQLDSAIQNKQMHTTSAAEVLSPATSSSESS